MSQVCVVKQGAVLLIHVNPWANLLEISSWMSQADRRMVYCDSEEIGTKLRQKLEETVQSSKQQNDVTNSSRGGSSSPRSPRTSGSGPGGGGGGSTTKKLLNMIGGKTNE